jgi:disulfide bond formation protein DsbB
MNRPTDIFLARWPLVALIVSALMLAVAHGFETFGGLVPCALCLKQREVYWVAMAVAATALVLGRFREGRPLAPWGAGLLAAVFLLGAGVAAFHAGVEWHWWPGPTTCTGGSTSASASDLMAALDGAKVKAPSCDRAAWVFAGLSMAGWNAIASLVLAAGSVVAALRGPRR